MMVTDATVADTTSVVAAALALALKVYTTMTLCNGFVLLLNLYYIHS